MARLGIGQVKPQTTIDHSKDDSRSPCEDVGVRPPRTPANLLVDFVVDDAEEWHEEEDAEEEHSDDGVGFAQVTLLVCDVDSETCGGDKQDESKNLQTAMGPDQAAEIGQTHDHCTEREDDQEGDGSYRTMGRDVLVLFIC